MAVLKRYDAASGLWQTVGGMGLPMTPVSFSAHKNGVDQTGITSGAFTKITFNTVEWDKGNGYDSSTSKFQPSIAGVYAVSATVDVEGVTDTKYAQVLIYKNGVVYKAGILFAPGTAWIPASVSCFVQLNGTTDYIEIYVYQNTGSSQSVYGGSDATFFQACLIPDSYTTTESVASAHIADKNNPHSVTALQLGAAVTGGKLSQFAITTSAELASVVSDKTGSGSLVFGTSPTINTPTIVGSTTIRDGNIALLVGANNASTSLTDAVSKAARIATPHYTIAEEPVLGIMVNPYSATEAYVNIGGGTPSCNCATTIRFFTSANSITTTGTEAARITPNQNLLVGITTEQTSYRVYAYNSKTDAACYGVVGQSVLTLTANGSSSSVGVIGQATTPNIPTGVSCTGGIFGVSGLGYVDTSNFAGTLATSYGTRGIAGISSCASGGVVTSAYGLYGNIYNASANGTITNAYGCYIDVTGTSGTITNRWGFYQIGVLARNYFAGNSLFGTTSEATSNGNAKIQSSNGIYLGNSANSAANVLDWYEEGSFTPVVAGGTTAGTGTYTTQTGTYTRIGNRVMIDIVLTWTAHTGTGVMLITGLPFTSGASAPLSVYASDLVIGTGKQLTPIVDESASTILLRVSDQAGGAVAGLTMDTAVSSLRLSGTYKI